MSRLQRIIVDDVHGDNKGYMSELWLKEKENKIKNKIM